MATPSRWRETLGCIALLSIGLVVDLVMLTVFFGIPGLNPPGDRLGDLLTQSLIIPLTGAVVSRATTLRWPFFCFGAIGQSLVMLLYISGPNVRWTLDSTLLGVNVLRAQVVVIPWGMGLLCLALAALCGKQTAQ